jgi:Quercetinase C-terminal cupin domain
LFILKGNIKLNGYSLDEKDAIGIFNTPEFSFHTEQDTDFVLVDVPMT